MEEVKQWMKKAEKDLDDARFSFDGNRLELASFLSHQAVEKALKALYILKFKKLWKTHDLVGILVKLGCSDKELLEACDTLNRHYIDTRYPTDVVYTEEISEEALEKSEMVIKWVKKYLKK